MGIQPIRKTVTPEIPDKLYFRIGDVARLCEVPAYVLRFWETEFPQLKPNKGGTGQRLYRRRDVEMALRIKSLLYDQGYTIPGARQVFKNEIRPEPRTQAAPEAAAAQAAEPIRTPEPGPQPATVPAAVPAQALRQLRAEMEALLAMLSGPPGAASAAGSRRLQAVTPPATPLRPRLVLEPRSRPERAEPQPLRLLRGEQQGDLFGFDARGLDPSDDS